MESKSCTLVIHVERTGEWSAYLDGKLMTALTHLKLDMNYLDGAIPIIETKTQTTVPWFGEYESVEVILHRRDKDGNEITEKLC